MEKFTKNPRVRVRRAGMPDPQGHAVVYWMQRAQRALDNPALDVAIAVANELKKPVIVFFAPVPFYPGANLRHYSFLAQGIPDIAEGMAKRNVRFVVRPYPNHSLVKFCEGVRPALVIGDENPLRETEHWREVAADRLRVPLWTVDADVIVPTRLTKKEHFGARTIRPKIHELLPEFLVASKNIEAQVSWTEPLKISSPEGQDDFLTGWKTLDRSVGPVSGLHGGTKRALGILNKFIGGGLKNYPEDRNHPETGGTSHLSPYLHFGHISPITVALAVKDADAPGEAKEAFLEQLIVRRELAVNFVHFNKAYDSFESREPWADRTLAKHAKDQRPVLYTDEQLERGETHDPLWNAAQKQMVILGWMHNYMRMYWAKKILEWSPSIAAAYHRCVWLNDRYEMDGRDPNGYAGIAWAIVGKHDRAWFERPIFGQIRYMSYASTSKKFDSKRYIQQIEGRESGQLELLHV
jgi:deoxyribodipyrimidine photo-lyase